jgi:ribosomal protein S18 acetylase RimI-like enzyme
LIGLRPVTDADLPFLLRLYASTRTAELAPLPWSEEQKQAFLRMQFQAQHSYYTQHYGGDRFDLVMDGAEPVGRFYVGRWSKEICVIDISFLPEHRGRGLGTALLRELLEEGATQGKTVSIHVEKFNPAKRLYERLGFALAGDAGVYDYMTCAPPVLPATAAAERMRG